jgi:glycosyltransferase involved in cell wall biosynthesis
MKLTIAIAAYNNQENISRCIDSLKNVKINPKKFEILVIDNCSTDETLKILEKKRVNFPNIRLIKNEKNIGRIENWNECLKHAKGEFITFLFTNDEIHLDNNIEELVNILDKNENISISISPYLMLNENKSFTKLNFTKEISITDSKYFMSKFFERSIFPLALESLIFRMSDIKKYKTIFPPDLPFNCDQVLSSIQATCRKNILLNNKNQIIWNNAKSRNNYNVKINDELFGHVKASKIIRNNINFRIKERYLASYYGIKFVYYFKKNKKTARAFINFYLNLFKKTPFSFGIDPIFLKVLFKKIWIKNQKIHEIYLQEIVSLSKLEKIYEKNKS